MVSEHSDKTLFVSLKGTHLCLVSVLNEMSHYLCLEHLSKFLSLRSGNKDQSKSGVLSLGTINIQDRKSFVVGAVHRMFNSKHDLYSLDTYSMPLLSCDNRKMYRHCQMAYGDNIIGQLKHYWFKYYFLEQVFPGVQVLNLQLLFLISLSYLLLSQHFLHLEIKYTFIYLVSICTSLQPPIEYLVYFTQFCITSI